jgi:hypothetical protein
VLFFTLLFISLIMGSVLQNVMNDELKRIWKESVVAQWSYAARSNREFPATLTGVLVEFRTRNPLTTSLISYRYFNLLGPNRPCKWSRIWMVIASNKTDTAVWVFVSSLYRIVHVCEGLTFWVGLILFGKLGTESN